MLSADHKTYLLHAPVDGLVIAIADVPDPAFSQETLGPGIAIEPLGDTLRAPAAGKVIQCAAAAHAVTLELAPGIEILLHLGIDTVHLNGNGLEMLVHEGQRINAGTPLIRFDIDKVARSATSLMTPIISVGQKKLQITPVAKGRISAGAPLAKLIPADHNITGRSAATGETEITAQEQAKVGLENGLHARPASKLRQIGQRHNARIILKHNDQEADANHLTALLNLGLMPDDQVTITVSGADAQKAAIEVKKFLETPEGITPAIKQPPTRKPGDIKQGILHGVIASPGHAVGALQPFSVFAPEIPEQGKGIDTEKQDLLDALHNLKKQLQQDVQSSGYGSEQADILTAHIALLDDNDLILRAVDIINTGKSAAASWKATIDERIGNLASSANPLIRERGNDLQDLQFQVINLLLPQPSKNYDINRKLAGNIVLAEDLTPSQLIALAKVKPAGICLATGGATSHTAVLCRSVGIPCLAGLGNSIADYALLRGKIALLDANQGILEITPSDDRLRAAKQQIRQQEKQKKRIKADAKTPAISKDGATIHVTANIISGMEAEHSLTMGADGIGLFRSEFLFLDRDHAPSAEEQRSQYQLAVDSMPGKPVVIRMLDIGADKQLSWLKINHCPNPALGIRGIRIIENYPELIETQLQALLQVRAETLVNGKSALQIMLPMVCDVNDVLQIRNMMETLAGQMGLKGKKDFQMPQLGAMIEVPSAALVADQLAQVADFFSIGTNDLTQYSLAIDREEVKLSPRLDVLHPALLHLIALCCGAAQKHQCPVTVCGASAGDEIAGPVLAAMGVTELSTEPQQIAAVKSRLCKTDLKALGAEVKKATTMKDATQARTLLSAYLKTGHVL